MTYNKCLNSQECMEFNSYNNILSTLSNSPVFQEFQQYKCKVAMFINQQMKSRESKLLCVQNRSRPIDSNINFVKSRFNKRFMKWSCDETLMKSKWDVLRYFLRKTVTKVSYYRTIMAVILIIFTIPIIIALLSCDINNFCIPLPFEKTTSSPILF